LAYFYSPGINPQGLGTAMIQARCSYGVHLDMNAGHTGFEFYRVEPTGQLPAFDRPLDRRWEARGKVSQVEGLEFLSRLMVRKMPLMNFPRYIHLNSRDFFYLTRRALLPGAPLEPLIEGAPDDGKWRIAGADDNEWPHALARTGLHAPGYAGQPPLFLITRIDPKQLHPVDDVEWATLGLTWPQTSTTDAQSLFLVGNEVRSSAAPGTGKLLGSGSSEPSPESSGAACIDDDGLLILIQRDQSAEADIRALSLVAERAGCAHTLYLDGSIGVAATTEQREQMAQQAAGDAAPSVLEASAIESPKATVTWLRRQPMLGARRIFQDTPILPPSKWALIQKRRVPYTERGVNR
jgi:hypothetical protein